MARSINSFDYETKFTFGKKKILKVSDEETCAICTDKFDDAVIIAVSECAHYFHKSCLKNWVCRSNGNCPSCRHDFRNLKQLVEIAQPVPVVREVVREVPVVREVVKVVPKIKRGTDASCSKCRRGYRNLLRTYPSLLSVVSEPYNSDDDTGYECPYHRSDKFKMYGQTMGDDSSCIIG